MSEVVPFVDDDTRSRERDAFPNGITTHQLQALTDYPEKKFKYVGSREDLKIFIVHINSLQIVYFRLVDNRLNYINHLMTVAKEAQTFREFNPLLDFYTINAKFKKSVNENGRKNVDLRAGYKFGNSYLVKAFFTFGQRTVAPGTAHVYQLLEVPLVFLVMGQHRRFNRTERLFPHEDLCHYRQLILLPHGCYRIPPNTTYLIISTQKNYFTLDIVPDDYEIPFPHSDPIQNPVYKFRDVYDKPAPTPYIEDPVPPPPPPPPCIVPQEQQQTFWIIPHPPPEEEYVETYPEYEPTTLEKTICVTPVEFVKHYQALKRKSLDEPPKRKKQRVKCTPLDLSMKPKEELSMPLLKDPEMSEPTRDEHLIHMDDLLTLPKDMIQYQSLKKELLML